MTHEPTHDVIILGAGSAGEVAAAALDDAGWSVLVAEPDHVGGECPFTACIPSKALLTPVHPRRLARETAGVTVPDVEPSAVLALRDRVVEGGSDASHAEDLTSERVELSRAHGRIAGNRTVELLEERRTVVARRAVMIATGAAPMMPDLPGIDDPRVGAAADLTTRQSVPEHLIVVGAGVVGCELAQAFCHLGSRVTVIEQESCPVPTEEPTASTWIRRELERDGIEFLFDASAAGFRDTPDGVAVDLRDGSTVVGDHVLVAVGRVPRTADIGLESVGIAPESLATDEWLRVRGAEDWLYAIGDVNGRAPYTHGANYQAAIAADHLLGRTAGGGAVGDRVATPRVMFTIPNLAATGMTEAQAREEGIDVRVVERDLSTIAAPYARGHHHPGWAKLVMDAESGLLVGATFVADEAGEMIHAATVAIVGEVPLTRLRHAIAPFPTMSEVWTPLLGDLA